MNIFNFNKKSTVAKASESTTHESSLRQSSTPDASIETPSNEMKDAQSQVNQHNNQASSAGSDLTKNVYNLIILDESGSMISIYKPALTGMNETLQTIRMAQEEHPEQKHFVSLIAFDSGHYNQIYDCIDAEKASDITEAQYRPGACTPLYDAMGRAITELRGRLKDGDVVLVTIITDGYENASLEYDGKAIKNLVESLKTQGWVFTYIGANQDVESVAGQMSIDNYLSFDANMESTETMFETERRSRKKFFSKLSQNSSFADMNIGYFDDDE